MKNTKLIEWCGFFWIGLLFGSLLDAIKTKSSSTLFDWQILFVLFATNVGCFIVGILYEMSKEQKNKKQEEKTNNDTCD